MSESSAKSSKVLTRRLSEDRNLQIVIIAARWSLYTEDLLSDALETEPSRLVDDESPVPGGADALRRVLERSLQGMVETLVAAGKRVVLLGQVPPNTTSPLPCWCGCGKIMGRSENVSHPRRKFGPILVIQMSFSTE